jgi:hypothetical protein
MASQGPLTGGTATTSFYGLDDWTTPTEGLASGGSFAYIQKDPDDIDSYHLNATNFGFSLPSSTVDGISASVRAADSNITGAASSVFLIVGGSQVGSNQALGTSFGSYPTFTALNYGGASSTWGATAPTSTQVNASNFGMAWAGTGTGNLGSGFIAIDGITITVTYTPTGGGGPATQTRSFFRKYS